MAIRSKVLLILSVLFTLIQFETALAQSLPVRSRISDVNLAGCPVGATAAITEDGLSMSLLFDHFAVSQKNRFSNCSVELIFDVPKNKKISINKIQTRGFISLENKKTMAQLNIETWMGPSYDWGDASYGKIDELFRGPISKELNIVREVQPDDLKYTLCSTAPLERMSGAIKVNLSLGNSNASDQFSIDSIDGAYIEFFFEDADCDGHDGA